MGIAGKLGFGRDENIRLETPDDMLIVRVVVHLLQDEPDKARAIIRLMSPRDRAVLSFHINELSSIVDDEESARRIEDSRKVHRARRGQAVPDELGQVDD